MRAVDGADEDLEPRPGTDPGKAQQRRPRCLNQLRDLLLDGPELLVDALALTNQLGLEPALGLADHATRLDGRDPRRCAGAS